MSARKKMGQVRFRLWIPLLAVLLALPFLPSGPRARHAASRVVATCSKNDPHDPSLVLVTAYCNCGICCSWRPRFWFFGDPVVSMGPRKGQKKEVGRTSSGRYAAHGTVAADPKVFPMGTKLDIPGYGEGRVEDTGGAIKGRHIDVWFPSHDEALAWGAQWLPVRRLTKEAVGKPREGRAPSRPQPRQSAALPSGTGGLATASKEQKK